MTPDKQREYLRKFFLDELDSLELNTGCDQFSRIQRLPKDEAVKETDKLVNILVAVCMAPPFDKIAVDVKARIIRDQMLKDPLFVSPGYGQLSGFNRNIVWKWLNAHWQIHMEALTKKAEAVVTVDERTPEEIARVQEIASEYLKTLTDFKPTYPHLEQDMKAIQREDAERQEGKKAVIYKTPSPEEIQKRELHDRWIRENHDILTGKPLPCWTPEDEWLKLIEPA